MSGGATKAVINMISSCLDKEDEVLVVCPDENGIYQYFKDNNLPGVKPVSIPYTYDTYPQISKFADYAIYLPRLIKRIVKNKLASRELIRICKQFKPDIIHSNTSVNNIGYLAAKSLRIPHIYHIREYGDKDFNLTVPFQSKKFLTPGNFKISITKDILSYKNLDKDSTACVIYDGVIKGVEKPTEQDKRYFLYAGRLTANKGIFDLLMAYQQYVNKEGPGALPLKLAGRVDAEIEIKIHNFLTTYSLADKVELLGVITDLSDLYRYAAAVIVPSVCEGFGFILPEAMSYGALTIGRNTGGTREQYDNGVSLTGDEIGLRFNTVEELSQLLSEVSHNAKSHYADMINRASVTVKNLYTIQASGSHVRNFYNKILSENKQNV